MFTRECVASPTVPYMVPPITESVASTFPKVAFDVFVDKSAAANCIPRVLRSRLLAALRAEGLEPVDLHAGITNDLPILSLLVSSPGVHAVLTRPASSAQGERTCIWRLHRSAARLGDDRPRTTRELALETARDFARAYKQAALAR